MAEQSRITVVQQVYYQGVDGSKDLSRQPYSRTVESAEQPYQRVLTVGGEWTPLDLGWLNGADIGLILIANVAESRSTYPTAEEDAAARSAVVEWGVPGQPVGYIPVGEDSRFCPMSPLVLRCKSGKAKVVITAVPK